MEKLNIRTKYPGRQRQQAMNGLLGKLIFMKMYEKELQTDKKSGGRIKILP